MQCKQCGAPVEGRKQYCNDTCSKRYRRSQPGQDVRVDSPDNVTRTEPVTLTQAMLDSLPLCVVRPTAQPGDDGPLPKTGWKHTKTYAQTIYNLLTMTVAELTDRGQWIPVWKHETEAA